MGGMRECHFVVCTSCDLNEYLFVFRRARKLICSWNSLSPGVEALNAQRHIGKSACKSGALVRAARCIAALWAVAAAGLAADAKTTVLEVLEKNCVSCHGGRSTKAKLDLSTREALLRGGESGAVVVPGKPEASLLLQMVRHEKEPGMPYKKEKLSDGEIEQIATWIKAGIQYNRKLETKADLAAEFNSADADRNHWAFRPLTRPEPPKISAATQNPVDQFILARLESSGLSFSPAATKEQLIRRVTFDLIGLPPTPEEIDSFLSDRSSHAYERLIDRLLASPRYGERWGRHWLDLARFAESDGFEHDSVRPHAWRYRDYVIGSFNADKPYDRFIREQLAGDELWPDNPEAIIATGFNLLGPDMVDSSDQVQRRHNTLNDITDTTALVFLGLTAGCARCHDHKFEPFSQRDYYGLQAFFTPARFHPEKPVPTAAMQRAFDEAMKEFNEQPKVRELAKMEAPLRQKIFSRKLGKLSPEAQAAHQTTPGERTVEQANLVLETEDKVAISEQDLAAEFKDDAKAKWKELLAEVKKLPRPTPLPKAMALSNGSASSKTFVLYRGEYSQPGDEVVPSIPSVLRKDAVPEDAFTSGPKHRTRLAEWIASEKNPLTARVMVNRIWQHHFGRGLVETPSDFGTHGQKPTHPELLDWLASEFIARGWSIKQMHKLLLMSATWQQTSAAAESKVDPENRLYARMNRVRLEGEVIRDTLLAVSGSLNLEMDGPGVFPPIPKELFQGAAGWTASKNPREHSRRSIYIFARRNLRFPFLEVFDAPDNNLSCPIRERSTTAPQALTLLNADEVLSAAKLMAARVEKRSPSRDEQVTLAYRLALGRSPSSRELSLSRNFLARYPLEEFCRALFNLNDFVYIE
jgi:mono/diheme cytochrome c family protein